MKFKSAAEVEMITQQIREADYPRGQNRARIDRLFDGFPPFSEDLAEKANVKVNVNFLEGTVLAHDARAQFYGAFLKPGQYFTAATDLGPEHKRGMWGQVVTDQVNKMMKRSLPYFEKHRSTFALDVLHGIGPGVWMNRESWCPKSAAIADIGIPANTLLTMDNLPFFYVYRSFTGPELIRLTSGSRVDKGWNMPLVNQCLKFIDSEMMQLMGSNWPEIWSPEKSEQRVKGDGGMYAGDECPTIDCFDFYFWNDDDDVQGWNRRIILDAWSSPAAAGAKWVQNNKTDFGRDQFLYNPGNRKYASKISEIMSFQFADLSACAPFQYHSVRSLGYLLYAVCNLQNRLRCKFSESVFEALMNYYRVKTMDDVDRALKVDLVNHGFVDETIQFIPPDERWQINTALVEMGMSMNGQIISSNGTRFAPPVPNPENMGSRKNQLQIMNEIQQTTALVQAAFNQAYQYQEYEYREIFRRFLRPNSTDPDVRAFRLACLKRGVPASAIKEVEAWDIMPTRVMGAGNQTMQMAISQQLLQMRNLFDPEPQREILRDITFNITGDADKAARWCPDQPMKISDSVHDAQISMGALMLGLPVAVVTGQNHKEYVVTLLTELTGLVQQAKQQGGLASAKDIKGFQNVAQCITQHLKIIAQDPEEKQFVAAAEKALSKIMNEVRAFAQRLQEMAKKQQQQNGNGQDPQAAGKLMSTLIQAKTKSKIAEKSHAAKTAQRQVSFEMEEKRKDAKTRADIARENAVSAAEQQRESMRSMSEGGDDGSEN